MSKPDMLLWLNDARGIYIPRDFAKSFVDRAKHVSGVNDEQWAVLENPEHELYWEVWDEVLSSAVVTDNDGVKFTLYQEGDLWLIPDGMQWSDEEDTFVWPDDEEDKDDTQNLALKLPNNAKHGRRMRKRATFTAAQRNGD